MTVLNLNTKNNDNDNVLKFLILIDLLFRENFI